MKGYDAWKTRTPEDDAAHVGGVDDSEECSTCGGDGVVVYDECKNGHESSDEVECPDCNGAGRITDDGPSFADDYNEHDIDDGPLPRESPL